MNRLRVILAAVCLMPALSALALSNPTALYNFEGPTFAIGQSTPLLNVAPAAGPAGFVATFLSASDPTAFHIGTARVNPSFTGQNLMDTSLGSADILTISLNQPVTSVRLDFALFEPGWLSLQSPAGSATASTALTQGGSLSFQSAVGFNSFSLAGYTSQGTPTLLGIDNLEMVVVPEPAIAPMIAAGLALWAWNRQRRAAR